MISLDAIKLKNHTLQNQLYGTVFQNMQYFLSHSVYQDSPPGKNRYRELFKLNN